MAKLNAAKIKTLPAAKLRAECKKHGIKTGKKGVADLRKALIKAVEKEAKKGGSKKKSTKKKAASKKSTKKTSKKSAKKTSTKGGKKASKKSSKSEGTDLDTFKTQVANKMRAVDKALVQLKKRLDDLESKGAPTSAPKGKKGKGEKSVSVEDMSEEEILEVLQKYRDEEGEIILGPDDIKSMTILELDCLAAMAEVEWPEDCSGVRKKRAYMMERMAEYEEDEEDEDDEEEYEEEEEDEDEDDEEDDEEEGDEEEEDEEDEDEDEDDDEEEEEEEEGDEEEEEDEEEYIEGPDGEYAAEFPIKKLKGGERVYIKAVEGGEWHQGTVDDKPFKKDDDGDKYLHVHLDSGSVASTYPDLDEDEQEAVYVGIIADEED